MTDLKTILPPHLFQSLQKHGLKTPEQIIVKSDYELLRCGSWTMDDISSIKDAASVSLLPNGYTTAYDVYRKEEEIGKVTTGCRLMDETLLNGGFRKRSVTEINGESGCGKTQIALQAAARAWRNGAVYICTEEPFPSKRLQQMFQYMKSIDTAKGKDSIESADITEYGKKIFILHITEFEDLKKCIDVRLPRLLESNKGISLVVVDSIAAPFRGENQNGLSNMAVRASHLKEMGLKLLGMARHHDLAVVCINQVSSVIDASSTTKTVPCLGLAWSKMITTRIHVGKTNIFYRPNAARSSKTEDKNGSSSITRVREMTVEYSPELPADGCVRYVITANGVFGVDPRTHIGP